MPAVLLFDYATNITIYLSIRYTNSSGTPQKAILACSGLLNGNFGSGNERHLSFWQAVKVVDKTEEEDEQGVITVREKERFSNELTLVFATGQVATLK